MNPIERSQEVCGLVGIDTITLRVPADRYPPSWWGEGGEIPGGGRFQHQGKTIRLAFSVPKRVHGNNLVPSSSNLAREEIAIVLSEAYQVAPIAPVPLESIDIWSIDVAMNCFGVEFVEPLFRGLREGVPKRSVPQIIGHAGRTLVVGKRENWQVTIYDKHLERGHSEDAFGLLRAEARYRSGAMRERKFIGDENRIVTVADLDDGRLTQLHRRAMKQANLDRWVAHPDNHGLQLRLDLEEARLLVDSPNWPRI